MNISFLSGTRADYSKIKPYIEYFLERHKNLNIYIFATGMHILKDYGETYKEIQNDCGNLCHIELDENFFESTTSQEAAHILAVYDKHLRQNEIDFVFVHGDRPEALVGAIAARLNNIPVCQIEAGDLSGSVDDSIRHAIAKLAHRFFVADTQAKKVLLRQGERAENIFVVGNSSLANISHNRDSALQKYGICFKEYAILIYHPVTTISEEKTKIEISSLMKILDKTSLNYVVIMPNNDLNHQVIKNVYEKYLNNPKFLFFKSLPLDIFTYLLKKSLFLIGNSSCGIKEAPYYHVPVINIGSRQQNRYKQVKGHQFYHLSTFETLEKIIDEVVRHPRKRKKLAFRNRFFKALDAAFDESFWRPEIQKAYTFVKER